MNPLAIALQGMTFDPLAIATEGFIVGGDSGYPIILLTGMFFQ